jgi:membrane protease YdiL (CAAX protease family)
MNRSNRRFQMPYRVLLVVIVGAILALLLAAFSDSHQTLTIRALLLLSAGVLLVIAIALEVIFRDFVRLRERLRIVEKKQGERP